MTTTTKTDFATTGVAVIDDAIVISFTSDGVEKKKTMPLTDKGLKIKDGISKIFKMAEYNPNNIWKDVKEWGVLFDCVKDLAAEAKAKQAKVDDAFAALWLAPSNEDPIDTL